MPKAKTSQLEVAFHEAGHAVMAYWLGRPFVRMTMDPTLAGAEEALGYVAHRPPTGDWFHPDIEVDARTHRYLEHHIMTGLAGAETQEHWYERNGRRIRRQHINIGAEHDRNGVVDFALYACGGAANEAEPYIEWLRQRVRNKVRHDALFWPSVEALAHALIEQKTLSWRKARAVIDASRNDYLASKMATWRERFGD